MFETRDQVRQRTLLVAAITLALALALVGIGALAREVRRRRRAEEALRTSERRFRLALRNAPVTVAVQDRGLKYVWAYNQRTARPEEIIGHTDRDLFRPEEAARIEALKGRVLEEDVEIHDQMWLDRPGGRIFLDIYYEPIHDEAGRTTGIGVATLDLTAVKLAEDAILRIQSDLRETDKRRLEFLAVLAHELRNPIAPIRTAAHILKARGSEDPNLRSLYDLIERQSSQMARLVDDLLDASRLKRGKIELRRERVDFPSLVAHAVEVCRPLIEECGHRVAWDLPKQALEVDGDPVRVEQMVCNLLTNACKQTPPGGEIRIAAERMDDTAILRVRDNGIGMTPEQMKHVFDMFYQAGHALGHREGGLGLGLTLVKSLAELHGGSIAADSEGLGQGSEFTLCLPALDSAHDPLQVPEADHDSILPPSVKSKHVMVIEDNPSVVVSVKMLLNAFGYRVSVAATGAAGIRQAVELQPDLALVDLGLPDQSGLEVAARIRAELGRGIHLIALTGFSRESDIAAAMDAGFDQYLVKSADPKELVEAVNACLS